jgi:hypothetical protein
MIKITVCPLCSNAGVKRRRSRPLE